MKQTVACIAAVVLTSQCASLHGARSVAGVVGNRLTWSADGRIKAICHETEVIGGVVGNWGPDPVRYRRIGQTFRCPGPRMVAVQLGIDDFATGQPGLCFTEPVTPVILSLRRGGPEGPVVAKTTVQPAGWGTRAVLHVDQPSDPSVLWYAEVRPKNPSAAGGRMWVTSTSYDVYPHGRIHLDGKPRDSDMHLRVTRSWTARARRPGKVVFWAARAEDRIWMEPKDTAGLMLADDPAVPVRLTAARNERVSTQWVATPAPDYRLRTAALSLGPIEGPGGARIQPGNVRIEWLRYSKNYWNKKTDGLLFPDPLAPTATAGVVTGRPDKALNTAFWLSIRVPTGIPAGIYRSTAVLVVNGGLILRRPIELEVFDFDLPKQTHTRCGLFHGMGFAEDRHLWFIEDLADFRLEIDSPFYASLLGALRDENRFSEAGYAFTLGKKMQKALITAGTRINELGQKVCVVTPWGDTYRAFRGKKGAREGIIRFWKTYYPILKKHGWVDQAYARMPDEFSPEKIDKCRAIVKLFRRHAPGVRIMVTDMDSGDLAKYRRVVGIADIWAQSSKNMVAMMHFYRKRIAAGEEVWPYIHKFLYLRSDPAAPRMFFWGVQRYGLHGATLWSIGPRGKFEHTWHGLIRRDDEKPGDGSMYFPGTHEHNVRGLWRSTRLYSLGDGMEDREYFWLMNRLAARAERQGKLTDTLRRRIGRANALPKDLSWGLVNFTHDMGKVDRARRTVAEIIVALQAKLRS